MWVYLRLAVQMMAPPVRDSGSGYRGRPKYKKTMAMRQVLVSLVRQLLIQGNSQSQTNPDC